MAQTSVKVTSNPAPQTNTTPTGNNLQLFLGTFAFVVCFSIFGSVAAMMPILRKNLHLDPIQVSIALATPVLLGSLGRIPVGILTDRYGGRIMFLLIMAFQSFLLYLWVGFQNTGNYWYVVFFLGMALTSFSVGVGFVSGWFPPARQGMALGIYGTGNIGQSLAAFGSPALVAALGYRWGFWTFGLITLIMLAIYFAKAENAPKTGVAKTLNDFIKPLRERMSLVLSLYYFLTFGGFIAMCLYLPILLTELFKLTPQDAGLRTAGFIALATAIRPIGGLLADRVGGRTVLMSVFPAIAALSILLTQVSIIPFTIGALGIALMLGLGNGAVFKLVPQYFPRTVGSVTGLVGAAGGLGGFFPPLVLGAIRKSTGSFTWGFILLGMFALVCLFVCWRNNSSANTQPA